MRVAICAAVLICGFVLPGQARSSSPITRHRQGPVFFGWIGVKVGPMTRTFADSVGMVKSYGAIFRQPKLGSPAAQAGIEAGDVITAINGVPLARSRAFATIISTSAPGSVIYLRRVDANQADAGLPQLQAPIRGIIGLLEQHNLEGAAWRVACVKY